MEQIKINSAKIARLTPAQAQTHVAAGYFDDNGGEPDGNLYLALESDLINSQDVEIVDGFEVEAYSGDANYSGFCGWSSRNMALTISRETADAIALDEYGIQASK
jgi:hypothetical protein